MSKIDAVSTVGDVSYLPATRQRVGLGVIYKQLGLPDHNPTPSTSRGKRRHEKRNDDQKKIAKTAWETKRKSKILN